MQGRTRRATAIGATAFVLAGSAALALPATASAAETVHTPCGSTVTAKPGDHVVGTASLLGVPLNIDLGPIGQATTTLSQAVNGLLGGLCKITVNVVDTVIAPVPVVGAPLAGVVNGGVAGVTNGVSDAVSSGARALSGQQPASGPTSGPGAPGSAPTGGSPGTAPVGGQNPGSPSIPAPNSPVLGGATGFGGFGGLPLDFSGYAPMRDYSSIPMAMAGVYSPSPGLRYGGEIPGYAPEFGLPGDATPKQGNGGIQNAGQAEALPVGDNVANGVGIPVLVAVLLLSGVSAGLVRTWVLRRTAATV
jgi:hypothetical protein